MQHSRFRILPPLLAAALVLPALAGAQTVHGRVTEAGSGAPVGGAIVLLVDENGTRQAATLADGAGEYRLTGPAAGTYRLRVERVGYEAAVSAPVELRVGETVERALAAEPRRVTLPPVVATGRARRCAGEPLNGAQAATMWQEARKALLSATLAAEGGRYRFVSQTRERETSVDGRRVMRDEVTHHTSVGLPFLAPSARTLMTAGYVRLSADEVRVFGLDAAAILSDEFLEQHCFGLRDGGTQRPGMVGLEFMPLRGRVRPDVRGVLWMDRATAELRFVEYGYTNLRFQGPVERIRGRVDFRHLPDGVWVMESWHLVVPTLQAESEERRDDRTEGYRIRSLVERSGQVVGMQRIVSVPFHPML